MKTSIVTILVIALALTAGAVIFYPILFPATTERQVLYWTDPMIPGDRSDHPGKSPTGMDRQPVYREDGDSSSTKPQSKSTEVYYTCPMHPSVRRSSPGACPICGMTLVKKTIVESEASEIGSHKHRVILSSSRQELANISTSRAEQMRLTKRIRAAGTIGYAQQNLEQISIRFPGRIEKLYVTFTGQSVRRGDRVAEIYSPEALSAQREYLMAKASFEEVKDQSELISGGAQRLLTESKNKLLLWGFTERQIAHLDSTNSAKEIITVFSPVDGVIQKKHVDQQQYVTAGEDLFDLADLSVVWLGIDVYEFEIQGLAIGQRVQARSESYPGELFTGTITFIGSSVEPSTRTVRIRAELPNRDRKLKPEMFLNAELLVTFPLAIVVPASAVVSTGSNSIVWLEVREGVYEPRQVSLGIRTEQFSQILNGINEGDVVVSAGAYLLDSESQMQSLSAGDTPDTTASAGHKEK